MLKLGSLSSIYGAPSTGLDAMRTTRRSFGHPSLAITAKWFAVLACGIAPPSTAHADCGPDAPSWCRCVYVELPPELSHLQHLWQPVVTIPSEFIPIETSAGSLIIHQIGVVTAPPTFLVAPAVPAPVQTTIGPSSVETFFIHTQSPIELPTYPTLHLVNHQILPITPWTPSGVLEYNATLTVVLPDKSYLLPTVPEPSSLLLLALAAASTFARHRPTRITNPKI